MDLALHLGRPVDELLRSMTAAEHSRWLLYARRYALPYKRLELLLAQLANVVARTMGGTTKATVADFMLQEIEDDEMPANVTNIEAARKAFGFNPRRKA